MAVEETHLEAPPETMSLAACPHTTPRTAFRALWCSEGLTHGSLQAAAPGRVRALVPRRRKRGAFHTGLGLGTEIEQGARLQECPLSLHTDFRALA